MLKENGLDFRFRGNDGWGREWEPYRMGPAVDRGLGGCYVGRVMAALERPAVIVLGGINMDLVTVSERFPKNGETVVGSRFLTYPGGKGANQAVAAVRMGGRVMMVGRVGNDLFGGQLLAALEAAGVDVAGVGVSDTTSGIAVIGIDGSSQNRIVQVLGANDTCGKPELERIKTLLPTASGVLLQLEVSIELSLEVARMAKDLGKRVILDPGPVRPLPEKFFEYCSVITPNETEAQALVGFVVADVDSAARAAEALLAKGAESAIVTLGDGGCYYATADGGRHVPAFQVEAVDTVGAGDAFNGALAVALGEGQDFHGAVVTATAAGALAVSRSGAQDAMPLRADVERLLAEKAL